LSPRKAFYVADLTAKANDGTVNLRHMGRLSDEDAVETLTRVKEVDRWAAQMFLIFSPGRPDVFPYDDLGLRTGIRDRNGPVGGHFVDLSELPRNIVLNGQHLLERTDSCVSGRFASC
jgi:hypothetical protein